MKIYYLFDTLCGWCWGFSPVIRQLVADYNKELEFEVISGGLALGARATAIKHNADYILNALPQVEAASGVQFGKAYRNLVKQGDYVVDSTPPAKFLATIKKLVPEKAFETAYSMQKAHFVEGKDLNEWSAYSNIVQELYADDLDSIKEAFYSPQAEEWAKQDFMRAYQYGAQGYPTVILNANKKLYALSRGYTSYENLKQQLDTALKLLNAQ
jgi:putative protein-disulfide isomerase